MSNLSNVNICYSSTRPEQRNRIRIHVNIRTIARSRYPTDGNHIRRADGTQTVEIDIRICAFETDDVVLAVLGAASVGASFAESPHQHCHLLEFSSPFGESMDCECHREELTGAVVVEE